MADIVHELRAPAGQFGKSMVLCKEAADEIEQLRAEVASKSEQIGKLYRVCNERDVLRLALQQASFMIDEITDKEGREGMTDFDFAEQVLALAHSKRDTIRAALTAGHRENSNQ